MLAVRDTGGSAADSEAHAVFLFSLLQWCLWEQNILQIFQESIGMSA